MGLFYTVPNDLQDLDVNVNSLIHLIAGAGDYTPPGLLEERMPEVSADFAAEIIRLRSQGRGEEVKRYKKHLLKTAAFMDNYRYNKVFYPWIKGLIP
jgi:hypothetical protein